MRSNPVVKNALAEFKANELIFASKLYKEKLSEQISEVAFYKTLQRMCEAGELVRVAKGTYHLPYICKYGLLPPSEDEIVKTFTENETGMIVGYAMYNALKLTTQVPRRVTIMSSSLEGATKRIRDVYIHKVPLKFSKEVVHLIQGLEVLQNLNHIEDINYSLFLNYAEKLAKGFNADAFNEIISVKKYKKSTIAFLREILNYHQVPHNLDQYLSSLSEYKYPKMEELYEREPELLWL